MRQRARYYLWNKKSDFGTGYSENIRYDDSGMYIIDQSKESGFYFSRMLDSGENGKKWRRAELKAVWYPNTSLEIVFFSSDKTEIVCGNKVLSIQEIITDKKLSFSEKNEIFSEFPHQKFQNLNDIMMTEVQGRYLWFFIHIQAGDNKAPHIVQLKVWLDIFDWMVYLPEVYQEDKSGADFTYRFLSIFQNLYEEMNEKITQLPACYDLCHADRSFLDWLSTWVGLEHTEIWNDEKLRKLLQIGADLFRRTGTPGMLSDAVELYTGVRPVLIENYFASDPKSAVESWKNNKYTYDPFGFTVLLPGNVVKSEKDHKALLQILSQYKPVHMRMQLFFIDPELMQNKDSDKPQTICLDGKSALQQRR